MLNKSKGATRLPAQDLERARRFYTEKLGLEPIEERPGGLKYRCGKRYFALFESAGAPWNRLDHESVEGRAMFWRRAAAAR